jgi:hypothetical protein
VPRARSCGWVQVLLAALVAHFPQSTLAARLLSSTTINLELLQTISSRYSDPDSSVYFRVQRDVIADGDVVVRAGTVVRGKLASLQDRGRIARSASLSLEVPFVPAVDGQAVRVIADMTRTGRNRDDAMAAGIIFFGAFGLLTRGSEVWIPAGSVLEAQVLNDRTIDTSGIGKNPAEPPPAARFHATVIRERIDGIGTGAVRFKVDHPPSIGMLQIQLRDDHELSPDAHPLGPWQVVRVGDLELPTPVATAASEPPISFAAWSVLQYCRPGPNRIVLRAPFGDGPMEAEVQLQFDPVVRR